jgi:predicted transcriptional regulator
MIAQISESYEEMIKELDCNLRELNYIKVNGDFTLKEYLILMNCSVAKKQYYIIDNKTEKLCETINIERYEIYKNGISKYENWEVDSIYDSGDFYILRIQEPNTLRKLAKERILKELNNQFVQLAYKVKQTKESKIHDTINVINKCREMADKLETLQKAIDIL